MYKNLRIIFTILSAICIAAVLPIGAFLNLTWAIVTALAAFLLYLLMLTCKQAQEKQEGTQNQPQKEEMETPSTNNDNTER